MNKRISISKIIHTLEIYTHVLIHCQFYLLLDNQVGEISDDDDSDKSDIVIIFYFVLSRVFLMS